MKTEKTIIAINEPVELRLGEKLSKIQSEFKATKSKLNKFGNYNYRSAEDVLEALKPFNVKYNVYFTINERLINANPPILESVATIWDFGGMSIDCTSVVGIDLEQKGMAMPQKFGSASSYAKKYALGNLLLIDDTKDDDATNTHKVVKEVLKPKKEVLEYGSVMYHKIQKYILDGGSFESVESKFEISDELKTKLKTV